MSRAVVRKKRAAARRNYTPLIIAGVLVAFAVVGVLVLLNLSLDRRPAAPSNAAGKVWGQAQAPVTIEIYSDFQ